MSRVRRIGRPATCPRPVLAYLPHGARFGTRQHADRACGSHPTARVPRTRGTDTPPGATIRTGDRRPGARGSRPAPPDDVGARLLRRLLRVVHHPVDPESVDQAAVVVTPELVFHG